MDSPSKPSSIRAQLVRFLLIGVLIVAVRFAYVVSVNGGSCSSSDFCFFSPSREGFTVSSAAASTGRAASFSVSGDVTSSNPAWRSREWRRSVDFYSSIFQDLIVEGFLAPSFKSLCVGTLEGQDVLALKEIGVSNAVGVSKKRSPPLVMAGDVLNLKFANNTFDFVFVGKSIDDSNRPVDLASEIVRVLKPEGFLVILTASAGDLYSIYSLQDLFPFCGKVRSREIEGLDSSKTLKEVVFQKEARVQEDSSSDGDGDGNGNVNSVDNCSVPEHKLQLVQSAEPLIQEEPLKPWLTLKRNIKNIKYLSSVADISFKRRYVYIDIGARSYGSSIGSWFKKQYPKQNHTFEIYAIEADKAFHAEYLTKKGIKLLPYAAWVRNESLSFEVNHDKDQKADEKGGKGMGRIRPSGMPLDGKSTGDLHAIQGFDFAEWLKSTVTEKDFVVMKMDVEGTEFDLIPRLFETGAICLIDELFLECHYNRWQRCCPGERSPKYEYTYGQCLELFTSLRDNGVLVHQWW